jgi:ubiquinone/menaquinone biosynthesis C-methylase UbiE
MNNKNEPKTLIWDASEYNQLAIGQYEAAKNLISLLNIDKNASILDVGCGDGKITAFLAKKVPDGNVTGVDLSSEMIVFAKNKYEVNNSNIRFLLQNAENLYFLEKFDLIFSSFALQWVADKNKFFSTAYELLKNEGLLSLIIPLKTSNELEEAVQIISSQNKWIQYFRYFKPNWHFETQVSIESLLNKNNFNIQESLSEIQNVEFFSKEQLENYILLWFPYLNPLPDYERENYFREVMDTYYEIMRRNFGLNSENILKIPRLDLTAKKFA